MGLIRASTARVAFSFLDSGTTLWANLLVNFGGVWKFDSGWCEIVLAKINSDRVCIIAYYLVLISTLPVLTPCQQYTATTIQSLLIAATWPFFLYVHRRIVSLCTLGHARLWHHMHNHALSLLVLGCLQLPSCFLYLAVTVCWPFYFPACIDRVQLPVQLRMQWC